MIRPSPKGTLIAEAVIASFLLIFAFLAAVSLFDASLRWESQSSNLRLAALIAERKMEEIRATSARVPAGSTFAEHIDSILAGSHPPYPDAPDFSFTVVTLPNHHEPVPTSGFTPDDGVHSPNSTLFTRPDNPAAVSRNTASPAYKIDPAGPGLAGDFQKNNRYNTYPYSRSMPNTYRLVKVSVEYGEDRSLDLVSLIGDPILPPAKPAVNVNNTLNVTLLNGSQTIGLSGSATFGIRVTTASGAIVEDVSCLWSIHPLSTGTADLFVLDAGGTRVRVVPRTPANGFANGLSQSGTRFRLFPQIRYGGIEARAVSDDIRL